MRLFLVFLVVGFYLEKGEGKMASILIDLGNSALKWSLLDDPENPFTYVHESSGILDEKSKISGKNSV